jgi:hypothetical protein
LVREVAQDGEIDAILGKANVSFNGEFWVATGPSADIGIPAVL